MITLRFRSEFSGPAQAFSLLLVCLTLCGSAAAQDTKLTSAESAIVTRIAKSGADVGVYFKTLDGKSVWSSRAEDVFHAASTMKIPVMMMTAEQDPKLPTDSFAAGAVVFLPKPFTTTQLQTMLRMLVAKAQQA